MTNLPIELELRKLGLKEKEVRVYLAGLGLGSSSAGEIAKKAGVARPTAYEIINTLREKGLFTEAKQKKKRYFTAQSPESILGMLRIKKKEIEEKEREFIRIIAVLKSKYSLEQEGIRTYKGNKELRALEENLSFTPSPTIYVLSSKINLREIQKREVIYQKIKRRLEKIEVKEVYSKKTKIKSMLPYIERKYSSLLNLKGTLILFDKAIFLSSDGEEGFLIESGPIINLLKSIFVTVWNLI